MAAPALLQNFINGQYVAAAAPGTIAVTTPHTGAVIAHAPASAPTDVDAAVRAAAAASPAWAARTIKDRASIFLRYHALVQAHAAELADLIVREHGKTRAEALAEVAKGNETTEFACSLPTLAQGRVLEVSRGVTCQDALLPLGVVAAIVPFNFPFMVPHWTLAISLVMGNTLVLKPSEKVPLTMTRCAALLKEAGVPDGVFNIVHGAADVVNALCDHPQIAAVSFVGSSVVAEHVFHRATKGNKRVLALGGAKNHLVAAPDADLEMTALDVVNSSMGCSGQRCMAASVLLIVGNNQALLDRIVAKASELTEEQVGPVIDTQSLQRINKYIAKASELTEEQVGPVIDTQSLQRINKYIAEAEAGGAKVLVDGRSWTARHPQGSSYIGPTILLHTNPADRALHDEIFGPVLSVLVVDSLDAALQIENANPYGNAACIYTQSGFTAEYATKRFRAGMCGVNIGVPVPREPHSFGGWGRSRFGTGDITGTDAMHFFSTRRKVTTKWAIPKERSWLN